MKQFLNLNKMGLTAFFIMAGAFFAIVYPVGAGARAENNPVPKETANKTDDKQAGDGKSPDATGIVPTGADFIKVTEKCAKCHAKQFSSKDNLKEIKWVVPGKPEISPVYKVIGRNKKPNGTYHNLTDAEKSTVYDYIKNLK